MRRFFWVGSILALSAPCFAQQVGNDDFTLERGILVSSGDVLNCPYHLVQVVNVNVTEDYNADTRAKIFGKFRDQAVKLSADAVVLVQKGGSHLTAWAWTRREYSGRAIRFVDRTCAPNSQSR
ncbi:MAG: hypothetical protein KGL48_06670 [Sphingomonadales bacterium]|nr:hypothetical protein [Sphingomonadales bacterium]MDE2568605.1 hypothetical protein [Sphingomonadales bacterium]